MPLPSLSLLIKPASSLCNMRCRYCFYADEVSRRTCAPARIMSEDTLEALVRRAFGSTDGPVSFAFQGGEPTLAGLDFYRTLLRLEEQYNVRARPVSHTIQTNGLLIDDEWAAFLAEHGFLVGLSLDGYRELHDRNRPDAAGGGTFDAVTRAARTLGKHKVPFNILCVVTDAAARHPIKVYESLKRFGYLQFIPCLDPFGGEKSDYSLSEERYSLFLRQTFDLWARDFMKGEYVSVRTFDNYVRLLCGGAPDTCALAGRCTAYGVVEADGSVYPCDFYVLDEWRLGSIHESGFDELLTSERARAFVRTSAYLSDECRACRYVRLCRGGCRREREPFVDGHPSADRHCAANKDFFAHSLPTLLRIAETVRERGGI